ncbi:MAG: DNA mismatch repair endonuclease MutL [Fusicatenibacter sp.]
MGTIAILDQNTIDKIAAGEVVERPASVVKELVENAIDAGATAITVEIRDGGISFIRITDNGSGIPSDQVPLAFLRHATSKIRSVEELSQIASLGFRGEALSSISAVSQVEMITKTPDSLTGTRYVIEGGIEKNMEEVGAPNGTTFLVRNLFYNTPARQKFLRTAMTEANAVTQVVEQLALSHPGISFKYMVNTQTKLHTSGNRNLKELVYHIYGRDIARELIEIHSESSLLHVDGFIGKPVVSRGNRNFENYYVNDRYVKSKLLAKAIEDGYHTSMMQHKYPFTLLYIQMDGTAVDVNVHPTKMELRFSRQEEIYAQITKMITDALHHREQIVHVSLDEKKKEEEKSLIREQIPEPFEQKRRQNDQALRPALPVHPVSPSGRMPVFPEKENRSLSETGTYSKTQSRKDECLTKEEEALFQKNLKTSREFSAQKHSAADTVTEEQPLRQAEQMELFEDDFLSKEAKKSHTVIGQVFDTYWLVQYEDNLYIIDQHAAHEKILYERMMKNYREKEILSQMVSPPMVVTLTTKEGELLNRHAGLFASFGYEISAFGGNEYAISAVPHNLYGIATEELFVEILDHLEEFSDKPPEILTEKLASMSCKAAVKGNQKLSGAEVENIIDELLKLDDPYHCPHGRPTIISFSRKDLEKKFKRID